MLSFFVASKFVIFDLMPFNEYLGDIDIIIMIAFSLIDINVLPVEV